MTAVPDNRLRKKNLEDTYFLSGYEPINLNKKEESN